jgi:hypothetical protein
VLERFMEPSRFRKKIFDTPETLKRFVRMGTRNRIPCGAGVFNRSSDVSRYWRIFINLLKQRRGRCRTIQSPGRKVTFRLFAQRIGNSVREFAEFLVFLSDGLGARDRFRRRGPIGAIDGSPRGREGGFETLLIGIDIGHEMPGPAVGFDDSREHTPADGQCTIFNETLCRCDGDGCIALAPLPRCLCGPEICSKLRDGGQVPPTQPARLFAIRCRLRDSPGVQVLTATGNQRGHEPRNRVLAAAVRSESSILRDDPERLIQPPGVRGDFSLSNAEDQHIRPVVRIL